MTRNEQAAMNGHVTGEIQTPYFDPQSIYDDDPVEGRSIIGWLAAFAFGITITLIVLW